MGVSPIAKEGFSKTRILTKFICLSKKLLTHSLKYYLGTMVSKFSKFVPNGLEISCKEKLPSVISVVCTAAM